MTSDDSLDVGTLLAYDSAIWKRKGTRRRAGSGLQNRTSIMADNQRCHLGSRPAQAVKAKQGPCKLFGRIFTDMSLGRFVSIVAVREACLVKVGNEHR
jgi:hypothetical protein